MTKLIEITGKALSGEWGCDDETGKGIPVLRTTNFSNDGTVNYDNVVTRIIIKKNLDEKFLQQGDILIEKSGGSDKQPVGRVIFFDGPEKIYLFNNFTGLLRVKNTVKWYPRYVFYALFANYLQGGTRTFENKTTGLHNLKIDDYVAQFMIKETPMQNQLTICGLLDKTRGVITLCRQQIQKFDDLIRARFVEMFGSPITNDKNFVVKKVIEVVKLQRGHDLPIQSRIQNSTIPVWGSNGIVGYHNEAKSNSGIITGRSGTLGKVYYYDHPFWPLNTTLYSINTYNNNIIYLKYLLEFYELQRFASGTGVPTLNRNEFHNEMIIDVPLVLQNEFADFVKQVDKSKYVAPHK